MDILMVGCGKMGGALLSQWIDMKNTGPNRVQFTVIDPALENVPEQITALTTREELGSLRFDVILIAIKPQMIEHVMPAYLSTLKSDGFVASIAAGFTLPRLQEILGTDKIVRIMPNLPASIGMGVAGLVATTKTTPSQRKTIETLMARTGKIIWVKSEDQLDRLTAISGSGPGYIFEIAHVYINAAIELGFTYAQARDMVLATISGTAMMAITNPDIPLEILRNNVTSKKGTTEAGLKALNGDAGLSARFENTLRAAYKRAVELR